MPRYYAKLGEKVFYDGSVLIVREDGTKDFISAITQEVQLYDRSSANCLTKEHLDTKLHEVFPFDPNLQVDEGL